MLSMHKPDQLCMSVTVTVSYVGMVRIIVLKRNTFFSFSGLYARLWNFRKNLFFLALDSRNLRSFILYR